MAPLPPRVDLADFRCPSSGCDGGVMRDGPWGNSAPGAGCPYCALYLETVAKNYSWVPAGTPPDDGCSENLWSLARLLRRCEARQGYRLMRYGWVTFPGIHKVDSLSTLAYLDGIRGEELVLLAAVKNMEGGRGKRRRKEGSDLVFSPPLTTCCRA